MFLKAMILIFTGLMIAGCGTKGALEAPQSVSTTTAVEQSSLPPATVPADIPQEEPAEEDSKFILDRIL